MPRYGYATLNHSTYHGLPTQWEVHLDAAAAAGYDALAPDIFWLRSLEAEGVALARIADGLRDRGLGCMEISGLAIGDDALTAAELEENLRYARALDAELVNTRIVVPVDDAVARRLRECAAAFATRGAPSGGTRVALEFSSGSQLRGIPGSNALIEAAGGADGTGVTLDTWHYFNHADGPDWDAFEALPLSRLANLQLSDGVPHAPDRFWDATMNERRLPGEGGFDLGRLAGRLAARGFDGAIVLEVLCAEQRGRAPADYARDSLVAARRIFG